MTYYIQLYTFDEDTGIELSFTDFEQMQDFIQAFFVGVGEHKEYSLSISMVQDDE